MVKMKNRKKMIDNFSCSFVLDDHVCLLWDDVLLKIVETLDYINFYNLGAMRMLRE